MTRNEAIKEAGIEIVEKIEKQSVDFSMRVTNGTDDHGYVEFNTSIDFINIDGDESQLIMNVLVDEDEVNCVDDLDQIDWESAIKNATFEIF